MTKITSTTAHDDGTVTVTVHEYPGKRLVLNPDDPALPFALVDADAEDEQEPYVLHYISADAPGDAATWSVWREQYADRSDDEPIDGSQQRVSSHATEAEANAEASRLQDADA